MWLVRRWAEFYFLVLAAILMIFGAHLPPPVSPTLEVAGPVEKLYTSGDKLSTRFSVSGRKFSTNWLEPGYWEVRARIKLGSQARVVAWSGSAWFDDYAQILELTLDGRATVSRTGRQILNWLRSAVFNAMGLICIWFSILGFRSEETLWQRYKRGRQKRIEQRREARRAKGLAVPVAPSQPPDMSTLAMLAFYVSLASMFLVPALVALVLGIIALVQIRKHPGKQGTGRAVFAVVVGAGGTIALVALVTAVLRAGG